MQMLSDRTEQIIIGLLEAVFLWYDLSKRPYGLLKQPIGRTAS